MLSWILSVDLGPIFTNIFCQLDGPHLPGKSLFINRYSGTVYVKGENSGMAAKRRSKEGLSLPSAGEAVLVSACLLGEKCRYNGGHSLDPVLVECLKRVKVIPVCPEVLGGLSVPREPSEIMGGDGDMVLKGKAEVRKENSAQDLTPFFLEGASRTWELADTFDVKIAVFKEKSPSCGVTLIYDGSFQGRLLLGAGVATALLRKKGVLVYSAKEWIRIAETRRAK